MLSDAPQSDDWQGRTGFVHVAVMHNFSDLSNHQVFINCAHTASDANLLDWAQPSLCLIFDNQAAVAISTAVSFRFIGFNAQTYSLEQLKVLAAKMQPYGIAVATNIYDAQGFQS